MTTTKEANLVPGALLVRSGQRPVALEAEHLTVGYEAPLMRHVELTVRGGELIVLLGPNGVGKSTLLRCLAGLQAPLEGRVLLDGVEVGQLPIRRRARRLALVRAGRPRVPLVVEDLVGLGRTPHTGWTGRLAPRDVAVVDQALERAGISHLRARPSSTLSDGEAQRAVIARCLAQEADVLLLDEPTAHLDAPARVEVMALLQGLSRDRIRSRAVVVALHELDLAFRTADRIWLLGDGQLVTGAPEDLILDGSIDRIFAREGLTFDPVDAAFRPASSSSTTVRVEGEGAAAVWTRRAVRRIGLQPADDEDGVAPRLRVTVQGVPGTEALSWRWELETPGGRTVHHSVAELVDRLRDDVAMPAASR